MKTETLEEQLFKKHFHQGDSLDMLLTFEDALKVAKDFVQQEAEKEAVGFYDWVINKSESEIWLYKNENLERRLTATELYKLYKQRK